jgi:hypothetical protein
VNSNCGCVGGAGGERGVAGGPCGRPPIDYAVKSSLLLSFLESVPEVSDKLKSSNTTDEKFSDMVKSAQAATVLVLAYRLLTAKYTKHANVE